MSNQYRFYEDKIETYYGLARRDVLAFIRNNPRRILDVGCGRGDTGSLAKKMFNADEVVGIEHFESAAEDARRKLDRVILGNIEQLTLDFPSGYFDCIVCADVLEHTQDPWAVLEKLKIYMNDNGILVASIPNIQHIYPVLKILRNRFEYEANGILDKTHLRFFTRHTIEGMFQETGFAIEQMGENRSVSIKLKLANALTFGLFRNFTVNQYLIVARKSRPSATAPPSPGTASR